MKRAMMAFGAVLLCANAAHADQEIQWKQVVNVPKGANQPQGVSVDILGLELGDTYAQAKAKLEKLAAETGTPKASAPPTSAAAMMQRQLGQMSGAADDARPLREVVNTMRLQTPGGFLTASYTGQIHLERKLPGSTPQGIRESIQVWLSAPSSGHQVIGVVRSMTFYENADQPRVSELIARLSEKLKTRPQVFERKFRFQYNDGQAYVPPNPTVITCSVDMSANSPDAARNANRQGNCDVILDVSVGPGISEDHAKSLEFTLSDNERTRQNVSADFQFFSNYARSLQSAPGGAGPKL